MSTLRPVSVPQFASASASVRPYKIDVRFQAFCQALAKTLHRSGGRHLHFGILEEQQKTRINEFLRREGLRSNRFVAAGLVKDIGAEFEKHALEILLTTGIPSYTIEKIALSQGLAILSFSRQSRGLLGWLDPEASGQRFCWNSEEELEQALYEVFEKRNAAELRNQLESVNTEEKLGRSVGAIPSLLDSPLASELNKRLKTNLVASFLLPKPIRTEMLGLNTRDSVKFGASTVFWEKYYWVRARLKRKFPKLAAKAREKLITVGSLIFVLAE